MSTTRTSTVSTGISTSTGDAGDEGYSETSYASETTVFVGDLSGGDGGGFGVGVQADATAIGTDTLALLEVTASVSDGTYVNSASASVKAVAAAQSPDGDAYAAATALLEVYGGADLYYGSSHSTTYTVKDETGSTTVSEVSASVHALRVFSRRRCRLRTNGSGLRSRNAASPGGAAALPHARMRLRRT